MDPIDLHFYKTFYQEASDNLGETINLEYTN